MAEIIGRPVTRIPPCGVVGHLPDCRVVPGDRPGTCHHSGTLQAGALGYRIDCKQGYVLTDEHGNITRDCVGRDYRRAPDPSWRILGITTRFNAHRVISLAEAAEGADIGQGWVHDVDHGTRRIWGMPKYRRAVRVTRITLGAELSRVG